MSCVFISSYFYTSILLIQGTRSDKALGLVKKGHQISLSASIKLSVPCSYVPNSWHSQSCLLEQHLPLRFRPFSDRTQSHHQPVHEGDQPRCSDIGNHVLID